MNQTILAVRTAFFAGVLFAVLEAMVFFMAPSPLDPTPTMFATALSVVGTGVLLAVGARVMAELSPRSAAGMILAVWAGVWGPHQARMNGWHRVGWAPPLVIGAAAFLLPGSAVIMGTLGGAAGAVFRHRGGKAGLTPIVRDQVTTDGLPDILLVTVDTVRSDALLMHGGRWKPDSPFSPMRGWVHYKEAIAPAPWTLPSMHSLMSSMPVREHGGGLPTSVGKSRRINESIPIAYMLQRAGYETTAIVSNPLLSPEHGFADGFDHWLHTDDSVEPMLLLNVYNRIRARLSGSTGEIDHGRDARVVRRAIEVMGAPSNRPRFVWVHLVTPQNYATDPVIDIPGWTKGTTDEDLLKMSYVASIDMTRRYLLRLNAAARSWIVVVTADHGESMGEGGVWGHGTGLNDAELRVPLAIRRPNTQGGVVTRQVSTADVGHTLLSVTGDARGFPGKNLLKRRQTPVEVGGVENDGSMFAARMASGKYIPRKPGTVGPGVMLSDQSQVHLKASGYLD
jgi:hypothetical protein